MSVAHRSTWNRVSSWAVGTLLFGFYAGVVAFAGFFANYFAHADSVWSRLLVAVIFFGIYAGCIAAAASVVGGIVVALQVGLDRVASKLPSVLSVALMVLVGVSVCLAAMVLGVEVLNDWFDPGTSVEATSLVPASLLATTPVCFVTAVLVRWAGLVQPKYVRYPHAEKALPS